MHHLKWQTLSHCMFKAFSLFILITTLCAFGKSVGDDWHVEYLGRTIITEGSYKNGQRTGLWSFYYPNKKLNLSGNFYQNRKNGEWKLYSPKGVLRSAVLFQNDSVKGSLDLYDKTGALATKLFYTNGVPNGNSDWFKNEHIHHRVVRIEGGKRITSFYPTGEIRSVCTEWHGKQNDTARVFYANGQTKELLVFYRNLLLNVNESWAMDGSPLSKGNLVDGDGLLIRYHDNGTPKSKVFYSKGAKNGIAQFYHENGELAEAGVYDAGRRSGIWKYYAINGELQKEVEFRKNQTDIEFENEFSFNDNNLPIEDREASFPGGSKAFHKTIKTHLDSLELPKKTQLWLSAELDEYGFAQTGSIEAQLLDGTKKVLEFDIHKLPRCIPASRGGLPVSSSLVEMTKW